MADTNLTEIRYLEEVSRGTTPSSALETLRAQRAEFEDERQTEADTDLGYSRDQDQVRVMNQARGQISGTIRYGNLDDLFEGTLHDDWETDGVSTGTDRLQDSTTRHYYTFEKEIAGVANSFLIWTGHAIDSLGITIERDAKATFELATLGNAGASASATGGTGSPNAAVTAAEMVGGDISAFTEGGGALSRVASLSFQIANSTRRAGELGSLEPGGSSNDLGFGRVAVTGSLRIYFADFTLYNKFQNLTASSIKATIADAAGNSYAFHFPEVRYGTGRVLAGGGVNQDIFVEVGFRAQEDTTETAAIVLERNPA